MRNLQKTFMEPDPVSFRSVRKTSSRTQQITQYTHNTTRSSEGLGPGPNTGGLEPRRRSIRAISILRSPLEQDQGPMTGQDYRPLKRPVRHN
jgi:hypothetical protein